jgi:hypothetical protein
VCREAVSQSVTARMLHDVRLAHRALHSLLNRAFRQMMPAFLAAARIN